MDFRFDETLAESDHAKMLRLVRECPPHRLPEVLSLLCDRLKAGAEEAEEAEASQYLSDAALNAGLACGWSKKAIKLGWGKEG